MKNIITTKEKELLKLQKESSNALDLVTSTINHLSSINDEIDSQVAEIEEAKAKLELTESGLNETKQHNVKIISKFRALIED